MTAKKTKPKAKKWILSLLALITLGVLGSYLYYDYYLEWQAIQKLSAEDGRIRIEAAEYLVSIRSKKAVKYWEDLIIEVKGGEKVFVNGRFVEEKRSDFDSWIVIFMNHIQPAGGEAIKRLIEHPNYGVRNYALSSVGELGIEGKAYCSSMLNLSNNLNFANKRTSVLSNLAKIGPNNPEVVEHFCDIIKRNLSGVSTALDSLPTLITADSFNSFKKLIPLIYPSTQETTIKVINSLNNLGSHQYPEKSKVLIPTLLSVLQSPNKPLVEGAISLAKKLPQSGFDSHDNLHLKFFQTSSNQLKFIHLSLYMKAGPETKKAMESFISSLEKSSLESKFNFYLQGNSPGIETIAYYLKVSSEDNQDRILKILDTHYSRAFLKLLRKHLDNIGERSLYLKIENTFFK